MDLCYAGRPIYRIECEIRGMTIPAFQDKPPQTLRVNSYDERHFATYLRLLDAAEEEADWREVVNIIFGLDPNREPERAKLVHDSHLARALWMSNTGYRHLLEPRLQ
jgi:Uncharacterized conserved protein (DUF2285)